jgi:hypothetical protein
MWASVTAGWVAAADNAAASTAEHNPKSCVIKPRIHVFVSPLLRTLQTAGLAFLNDCRPLKPQRQRACESQRCEDGMESTATVSTGEVIKFSVMTSARELWWSTPDNRGRFLHSIEEGASGGTRPDIIRSPVAASSTSLYGDLEAIPATAAFLRRHHSSFLHGLDELEKPSLHWDPADEARASKRANSRRSHAAIMSLVDELCAACIAVEPLNNSELKMEAPKISARALTRNEFPAVVVVCHFGVIQQFTDLELDNGEAVAMHWEPITSTDVVDSDLSPRQKWPVAGNRCLHRAHDLGWTYQVAMRGKADRFRDTEVQ